jgi:flavin reductase (DIM6/NTAB) family NADH-FMN oxidoreductase RutF
MHYEPARESSGFPHSPFTSCCVPRPIGWISTVSASGVRNIAPFSQFQNVTWDPPTVLFCSCGTPQTDTYVNAVETGEFVWNMATYELRETVARTATPYPPHVDEFDELGIETAPSLRVKPPRVAASPVHFECAVKQVVDIPGNVPEANTKIVIGEVLVIHIADDALTDDGRIDVPRLRPLARLGYLDYTSVESAWEQRARDLQTLHHHVEQPPEARILGEHDEP